ncbi:putative inorganic phosphate cotransporter isoform X1 [Danaus plexippus]|uniref:putative inorganic phosphate cotransporter isoform X1 n=1 Tax=Danaus plexippus TaxID=13037 RepID=UPI002AAF7278|nr:putative inorganic phosphate cotransporter isoform X1 [Danaus plexippus]
MVNESKNNDEMFSKIKHPEDDGDFKVSGWGYRHQQCLILFFALTTAYSMRACMGVALVAMVDNNLPELTIDENHVANDSVFGQHIANITNDSLRDGFLHSLLFVPPYPQFKWSKKTQDIILSSFFWGYMLLQIPAGQLAYRYGARYLLTTALFTNSVLSFCFPWAAFYGGWVLTMIFRIVQGLTQACIIPGMHTMFGKWTPLEERGRLAGWAYGGQALGAVLGLPITGFVASSPLGWPGLFRFYGILTGIIGAVMLKFGVDSPAKHPKISSAERRYIEERLGNDNENKKNPIPWSSILTCPGMYAIIIAHIGQTWGQLTLYSEVPAFMDKVVGVNIKANGLLTALPFLCMWVTNFFFSWFTDMLIVKKILSVRNTRRLANSLGYFPAALGMIALAYLPKNIYIVETLLIIICSFSISAHVGFQINHIDISPNYSGTMMSISNFVSNLVGSCSPLVAAYFLTDVTNEFLWRKVFFVAAGLYFFTNVIYLIFATAERAEWDSTKKMSIDNELELMVKESKKQCNDGKV